MVQKSGVHQLRLVVYLPLFTTGFIHVRWFRISESSTVIPSLKLYNSKKTPLKIGFLPPKKEAKDLLPPLPPFFRAKLVAAFQGG